MTRKRHASADGMPLQELEKGAKIKILIELRKGIGDIVMALPMLKAIRNRFPDAYLAVLLDHEDKVAIFEASRVCVNRFYIFDRKKKHVLTRIKNILEIRWSHFDAGLLSLVTHPRKGKWLFQLLGIRVRIGEQFEKDYSLANMYRGSFIERNFSLLHLRPAEAGDRFPHLWIADQSVHVFDKTCGNLDGCIVVNIGGGTAETYHGKRIHPKAWPYMRCLVEMLSKLDAVIVLMGGEAEKPLLDAYGKLLQKEHVVEFIGTPIRNAMQVLRHASLSIGVDTGMQHIAAALGVKTLTLFGPTNPKTCAPCGKGAHVIARDIPCRCCIGTSRWGTCDDRRCMSQISPQQVFREVVNIYSKQK